VARAAPEARAGGNIRPRGAAHDPGASRRSISCVAWRGVKMTRMQTHRENKIARPHPEERAARLEGCGADMLRDALLRNAPQHEEGGGARVARPLHAITRHGLYAPRKTRRTRNVRNA